MAAKSSKKPSSNRPVHLMPGGKARPNPASSLSPSKPKDPAPKRKPQGYKSAENREQVSKGKPYKHTTVQTSPAKHTPTKYTDVRGRSRGTGGTAKPVSVSSIRADSTLSADEKKKNHCSYES